MSQITTHVLDTSGGRPAAGIRVRLESFLDETWQKVSEGTTNTDGRIADLLAPGELLKPGIHRLVFSTAEYFSREKIKTFYPLVTVEFILEDDSHYHIPLLLSPYGYSTYRGS
jgi:hydroxyisourate hydrolase